ncbi:peptide deformylase [Viridibacillus sp. FSL R5-0477]|uniref:Peptide deformylase n=1 Tax=Viridibacillus arenosi FSL R5-213 TaxID=1227360 RepID=W4EYV3_9BACL|nr:MULTISPECIES: peptide deformylase [Viridibacillus]ETT85700.1 peptide deformylase 2 [Viridibacillus arenosi FSL R5-213]OMC83040.1 peptide deformylase [Viridibacillus sp. FSL H8-0123]OMC88958.1 peptide deformylase [Viridibacillus sp. FSL H7-0596]OMC93587.1 peptide deformylase [Viridibacillus arenosi]
MILMDNVIREGHPTLRTRAKELTFPLTPEDKKLGQDLLEFLINSQDPVISEKYDLRSGIGIAAPQINESKRMFALHLHDDNDNQISFVAVNPKIVSHSVENTYLTNGEGCLSVDRNVAGYVPRHARITVKYHTLDGEEIKMRLKGIPAIAFQHELDHLNGVMFYDHINESNPFADVPNSQPIENN